MKIVILDLYLYKEDNSVKRNILEKKMLLKNVNTNIAMNVAEILLMNYMLLNSRYVRIDVRIYQKILYMMNVGKTFVLIPLIRTKHLVNIVN